MFFFFSSRRRHTRWPRDWSSDVCSSDLGAHALGRRGGAVEEPLFGDERVPPQPDLARSEERRVGKECRCRWSPHHEKRKKMMISVRQAELTEYALRRIAHSVVPSGMLSC